MIQRLIPSGLAAAMAGGTMAVALSCCPSFAFTLSAPSLAQSAVKADVQQVYYDHYNNSYRVRHYVPKTNPYHNAYHHPYHHPYHYDHYNNSYRVRHYVPKTKAPLSASANRRAFRSMAGPRELSSMSGWRRGIFSAVRTPCRRSA
jgi:hypothetical protein